MSRLLVFTGAGISAESGVPTFRGQDGLWEDHKIERICNYWTWDKHYSEVHDFYNARRASVAGVNPNDAHRAVAEWQALYDTVILTQNIDDLFEKAGCSNVIHLHGTIAGMRCIACGNRWNLNPPGQQWNAGVDICPAEKCNCKKAIKPDVIFFGEEAPNYRIMYKTFGDLKHDDVIVVIGTSSQVIPIHDMVSKMPGFKILNNLEAMSSDEGQIYDRSFYMPATQATPLISELLKEKLG